MIGIGEEFSRCNSRKEPGVRDLWEKRHARGWKRSRSSVSLDLSSPAYSTHVQGWRNDALLFIIGVTVMNKRRMIHEGMNGGGCREEKRREEGKM